MFTVKEGTPSLALLNVIGLPELSYSPRVDFDDLSPVKQPRDIFLCIRHCAIYYIYTCVCICAKLIR